ncbi:MAG: hypothetical protein HOM00_06635 [Acidimicrobiaceae bacterium]|nr:hypothetical protein [Acidimicrobiaceae bacterium]
MRFSTRSIHSLRHPHDDVYRAVSTAVGPGYAMGSTDPVLRTVLDGAGQIAADQRLPVDPVAQIADVESEMDLIA